MTGGFGLVHFDPVVDLVELWLFVGNGGRSFLPRLTKPTVDRCCSFWFLSLIVSAMMVPGEESSFSYFLLFEPLLAAWRLLSTEDCFATLSPISPAAYMPAPSSRIPSPVKLPDL